MIRRPSFGAALHVGGEPVGREGIGHGLHGRAQRALPEGEGVTGQPGGHGPPVRGADLLGHLLGLVAGQPVEGPPEQGQHEVVAAHGDVEPAVGDDDVALRRPPGAAAAVDPPWRTTST